MIFRGWQKTSLNEWPGKICSVVFVAGCNFRCPFCYNRDLVLNPGKLPVIKEKEVLEYCQKNKDFFDGLMITGGEPLALVKNRSNLTKFIKRIKKNGLKVGIETNGSYPEMLEFLIKKRLTDYVAMDIKAPLNQEKYNQLAGANVDLKKIKKSIKMIIDSGIDSEFRTTVVPGLLDKNDILEIVKEIKGAKKYYLQKFQQGKTIKNISVKAAYDQKWFKEISEEIKKIINIELRI